MPTTTANRSELSLIGIALQDAALAIQAAAEAGLNIEAFTLESHRTIWRTITAMHASGAPVESGAVLDSLRAAGRLEQAGGVDALEEAVRAGFVCDLPYHVGQIRLAGRREALRMALRRAETALADSDPALVASDLAASLESLGEPTGRTAYSVRSWGAIAELDLPPLDFFWGSCFALGRLHVIFGQGGLGKSRLSLNIARNQVLGLPFANMPTGTRPLRHLLLGSENSIHRLRDDIRRMSAGLSQAQIELLARHVFLATLEGPMDSNISLGDPANITRWRDTIRTHRPDVLWVDPWGDVVSGDQNDDSAVRQTIGELLRLARTHRPDAAVVILAHARTGVKNIEQAVGYDAANFGKNSKALFSSARCVFNLAPGSEDENPPLVMAHAKSNDAPRVAPFALRLNADSHLYEVDPGFDFEAWKAELSDRAAGRRKGPRPCGTPGITKAAEAFRTCGAVTKTQSRTLLREAGMTRDQADDAIRQLLHEGRLVSWTPTGKNMPTFIGTALAIQSKQQESKV